MSSDYERGQWKALNRVLALLQTYDEKHIRRSKLYHDLMEMRPVPDTELTDEHTD